MGSILLILPGLFELLEKVVGPLLAEHKGSIISSILGSNGTLEDIMSAISGTLKDVESEKLEEIKAEVATLLAQTEINKIEAASNDFLSRDWRPMLAWGVSILILLHLSVAEGYNIYCMVKGYALAPLDTITVSLMFGILGLHIGAKTIESVNSNQ